MKYALFVLSLLFPSLNFSQVTDTTGLNETIIKIIQLFAKKDAKGLNAYVHPEYGAYVIYQPGVMHYYKHIVKIDPDQKFNGLNNIFEFGTGKISAVKIKYASVPEFSCETMAWSKQGCFADFKTQPSDLSKLVKFFKETENIKVSDKELSVIRAIEKTGVKICDTARGLIFFLTQDKSGKWFFTGIDVTTPCDA